MPKSKLNEDHAASVAQTIAAHNATARPGIYNMIEQEFLNEGREGLETQLQKDFYDYLLRKAASEPGLDTQTVITTQGVIPYLTDLASLEQLRKIDSTVLGTVSDIIRTLPQPRPARLKDEALKTSERLKALGLFKAAEALDGKLKDQIEGYYIPDSQWGSDVCLDDIV